MYFTITEYIVLRKLIAAFASAKVTDMEGDSHRSGGFTSLKVHNVPITKDMLAKVNQSFKERFNTSVRCERCGAYYVLTKC